MSAAYKSIGNLVETSKNLLQGPCKGQLDYDPATQLPTLPPSESSNPKCSDALYQWYLDGQTSLSKTLVVWSPAKWDGIYLANYEKIEPSELFFLYLVCLRPK